MTKTTTTTKPLQRTINNKRSGDKVIFKNSFGNMSKDPNLPDLGNQNKSKETRGEPPRLKIIYKDNSKETYKGASIGRKENNTLWILFFGRVICLKNVEKYSFTS